MMTRTSCLFPETEDLNHLPLPLGKGHGYSKSYLEGVRLFLFPLFLALNQSRLCIWLEINRCPCHLSLPSSIAASPHSVSFSSYTQSKWSPQNSVLAAPFSFNDRLLAWFSAARSHSQELPDILMRCYAPVNTPAQCQSCCGATGCFLLFPGCRSQKVGVVSVPSTVLSLGSETSTSDYSRIHTGR